MPIPSRYRQRWGCHRITEWLKWGRTFGGHLLQLPFSKQCELELSPLGCAHWSFQCLQGGKLHILTGQFIQLFNYPPSKKVTGLQLDRPATSQTFEPGSSASLQSTCKLTVHSPFIYYIVHQFAECYASGVRGHNAEGPAKLERSEVHCSPLICQACYLIIEVYQFGQTCNNCSVNIAGLLGESWITSKESFI